VRKIETELKNNGYEFKINKLEFNNGKLISIKGKISRNNRYQYFAASDFDKLIITDTAVQEDNTSFNFLVEAGTLYVDDNSDWQ
jgi:hypothetical protein